MVSPNQVIMRSQCMYYISYSSISMQASYLHSPSPKSTPNVKIHQKHLFPLELWQWGFTSCTYEMLSDITISHSIKHSRFNFSIFFINQIQCVQFDFAGRGGYTKEMINTIFWPTKIRIITIKIHEDWGFMYMYFSWLLSLQPRKLYEQEGHVLCHLRETNWSLLKSYLLLR